ncbi:hypothetical protein AB835_08160 [Candidatus Endobugula sertula]|uniref:Uncharacterized protein n=1 Tax=Candidatus Endobugula sertula TaxID=62101 RepID=A0A1D2QPS5_9GAMM|nr:hypothetical protein AB835_08160 [Candidatus Endobugula sertula]
MVVPFPTQHVQEPTTGQQDMDHYENIPGADQAGEGIQDLLALCQKVGIDPKKIKLSKAGEKPSLVEKLSPQQRRQLIKNNNP